MKPTDVIVDPRSLGDRLWLTDVSPVYAYDNNRKRTDVVTGYRYEVALPDKKMDKIAVKIEGEQQMETPESGFVEVKVEGLEIYLYWMQGDYKIGARATAIMPVVKQSKP